MRFLLTICILHLVSITFGQHQNIDSLNLALSQSADIDKRIKLLMEIVDYYLYEDLDKSVLASEQLIAESDKSSSDALKASSIYSASRPLIYTFTYGNMLKAKSQMEKGIKLSQEQKMFDLELNYHVMLAVVYGYFNESDKALQHNFIIIENQSHLKDLSTLSATFSNIGRIYQEGNDTINARKYYRKAVDLNREIKNHEFLAVSLSNLASVTNNQDKAESMILEAIQIVKEHDLGNFRLGTFQGEFGDFYFNKKRDYASAINWYRMGLQSSLLANDMSSQSTCLAGIGNSFLKLNVIDSSLMYLNRSIAIDSIMENDYNLKKNLISLSELYLKSKNYQKAFNYLKDATQISERLYDSEKAEALSMNAVKFETVEKEAQITKQQLQLIQNKTQRNNIIAGALGLFLVIGAISIWYFERQKRLRKIAQIALDHEIKEKIHLQDLDKMKMQFFTNVSHELRTPLTLILGPLSQVLEKIEDGIVKKKVVTAFNNAERLDELITETLEFRNLEEGTVTLNKIPCVISNDIRRIFYGFSSLAEIRNITQKEAISISDDLILAIDIEKVEKILNNLISNALKFSVNGSEILVNASYEKNQLIISITDNGSGIAIDEQEKIFNRFYQAKHNLNVHFGGTGIGLAFSKELAEFMGGRLTVQSTEGKGSTFTFSINADQTLPAPSQDIGLTETLNLPSENTYVPILINGVRPDILIVEDNIEMQEYLKSILEDDFRCHVVNDGFEAIQKVQTQSFHLISSDVMMPNMDGFRLKEKINELKQARGIPFIFLTARSLEEDKLMGLRLGVDDYVTKPFNKQEYKARINNLLKNYKLREEGLIEESLFEYTESADNQKLKEAERIVLKSISNPDFKVSELADQLHYSQRQLARVIQNITGLTPVGFVLELRLLRAYHLIKSKSYNSLSEVRDAVGIDSSSYFSRKFKERFGVNPSEV